MPSSAARLLCEERPSDRCRPCTLCAFGIPLAVIAGVVFVQTLHSGHATAAENLAQVSDTELMSRRAFHSAEIARIDAEVSSRAGPLRDELDDGDMTPSPESASHNGLVTGTRNAALGGRVSGSGTASPLRASWNESDRGAPQADAQGYETELVLVAQRYEPYLVGGATFLVTAVFVAMSYGCSRTRRGEYVPPPSSRLGQPELWNNRQAMTEFVRENLEAERYADFRCHSLLINRPWYTMANRSPPIQSDSLEACPNGDWLGGERFPGGHEDLGDMKRTVASFLMFLWRKNRCYLSVAMMVLQGLLEPASALIFGWLLNEVKKDGNITELMGYSFLMMAINWSMNRAYYVYMIDVPLASVRYEFTYRLQRQFLGMSGELAEKWPVGRCTAMMSYDVPQAVNRDWQSGFELVKCTTNLLACTGIMIYTVSDAEVAFRWSCIAVFASLFAGAFFVTTLRMPNCLDLALRKRDWHLGWMAICSRQIQEHRDSSLKFAQHRDADAQEVSDAAMVYRMRVFHYYFVRLAATLAPSEMAFYGEVAVCFIAGMSCIRGRITTGDAAALIGVVKMVTAQLKVWVKIFLDIIEGYASLPGICDVLNMEVDMDRQPSECQPKATVSSSDGLEKQRSQRAAMLPHSTRRYPRTRAAAPGRGGAAAADGASSSSEGSDTGSSSDSAAAPALARITSIFAGAASAASRLARGAMAGRSGDGLSKLEEAVPEAMEEASAPATAWSGA